LISKLDFLYVHLSKEFENAYSRVLLTII